MGGHETAPVCGPCSRLLQYECAAPQRNESNVKCTSGEIEDNCQDRRCHRN